MRWLARATMHLAGLERLAERIEHLRRELRQLVEEEHAVMGERDFARPRADAAADHRRHRGGMMRRAERPPVGELSVGELAGDRGDHRDFQELARREAAAGSRGGAAASIDFPAPGGPTISMLWPPAAAISSARLALSWPLMSFMSGMSPPPERIAGCGRDSTCVPRK